MIPQTHKNIDTNIDSNIEKCLLILNLNPGRIPTKIELKKAFDDIRLAHEQRAKAPVTPLDMNSKRIYEQATSAYEYLLKSIHVENQNNVKNFKIGLIEYLKMMISRNPFKIVLMDTSSCDCKMECSSCNANNYSCRSCNGCGWVHYCELCNGTGHVSRQISLELEFGKFGKLHKWSKKDYDVNLQILSEKGYYIENDHISLDVVLDAKMVTDAKFNHHLDLTLGDLFSKPYDLIGLENFCDNHYLDLSVDYPQLPFKTLVIKPKFKSNS